MNNNKKNNRSFYQALMLVAFGVLLYWGLNKYKTVEHWLAVFAEIFASFVLGCIIALVLLVLGPIVATSFLPQNLTSWLMSHVETLTQWIINFLNWYRDVTTLVSALWKSLLLELAAGAVCYALCYLIVRRMTVRSK